MNAKRLLTEMPIDFGGQPDFIAPNKKRRIVTGQHPYREVGAFPQQPGEGSYPPGENEPRPGGQIRSYAELLASDQYPKVARKLAQYAGVPLQQLLQNPMRLHQLMGQAMQRAMQVQAQHKEELEQAAIDVVLGLPEFSSARQAVADGELRVKAELVTQVNPGDLRVDPEEPDEEQQQELEIAQIAQELDLEKQKRRMVNLMIQGAAVNKNYAFHQVADRLNAIDPQLVNAYGFLMAFGDFMYWATPEEMQAQAHGGGGGGAPMGKGGFYIDEDGVPVVHAQAVVFPLLIHELVKGLMEYLSHSDEEDPETRRFVQGQVDTLNNEPWDIKFGAPVWRQILRVIGNENQELMPHIYQHLLRMPPEEFNRTVQQILRGQPEARQMIRNLVAEIRGEMEESAPAKRIISRLIG